MLGVAILEIVVPVGISIMGRCNSTSLLNIGVIQGRGLRPGVKLTMTFCRHVKYRNLPPLVNQVWAWPVHDAFSPWAARLAPLA